MPYGVIHQEIFDSSLAVDCHARWVFQDMIILADAEDNVMMTAIALAMRTRATLEEVESALAFLLREDLSSKSSLADGCRITEIKNQMGGVIGYHIVNRHYYKRMMSRARRREYQRDYRKRQQWAREKAQEGR